MGDPPIEATGTRPVRAQRYASIVDVHVILGRGGKILLLRRAGDTFASGQLCLTGVRAGSPTVAC
jgi:hypothetical protein